MEVQLCNDSGYATCKISRVGRPALGDGPELAVTVSYNGKLNTANAVVTTLRHNPKVVKTYRQTRSCRRCESVEERRIPPEIAAFESRRDWHSPCIVCGHTSFHLQSSETPEPNDKLLEQWAFDAGLQFFGEDEEQTLAFMPDAFSLLTSMVVRRDIPSPKRAGLLCALGYIARANTRPYDFGETDPDYELGRRTLTFLTDNLQVFDEIELSDQANFVDDELYMMLGLPVPEA